MSIIEMDHYYRTLTWKEHSGEIKQQLKLNQNEGVICQNQHLRNI